MAFAGWIVATLVALSLAGVIWVNGTLYGQNLQCRRDLAIADGERARLTTFVDTLRRR